MSRIRIIAGLIAAIALVSAAAALSSTPPAAKPAAAKPPADRAKKIERGRVIAMVSACNDCHTPGTMFGAPDFSRTLSGSELGWQGPWGTSYARNLTPDVDTGVGHYKEAEIVNALKGGRRLDGSPMMPPMPWQNLAAYSDDDLHALAAYLLSLKPVKHAVPDRLPPGQQPTGSFIALPMPAPWDAPRTTSAPADSGAKH